jgi:PAS domain S-box-containing protein
MKILIVDDNDDARTLLERLLRVQGYDVEMAKNGREALDQARLAPPALVISDILMPVMDGYDLCRNWKQDEQLKLIPFIFNTATYTDPKDEEFTRSLGAQGFFIKGQQQEELLVRVRMLLVEKEKGISTVGLKPLGEEMEVLRKYNAVLFRKLEKKVQQLQDEIAERKRAEEKLREADAFTRSTLNALEDVFYVFGTDGKYILWNTPFVRMSGYSDEEIRTMKPTDFFRGEDVRRVAEAIEKTTREGMGRVEAEVVTKDKRHIPYEFTGTTLKDLKGNVIGVAGSGRDLTDRKRASEALRKSEEKFSKAFNATPAAIVICTVQGIRIIEVNEAFVRITGFSHDEAIGRALPELGIFGNPEDAGRLLQKLMAEGKLRNEECHFLAKSGEMLFGLISAELLEIGQVPCFLAVTADITARKRAEKALAESEEKLNNILQGSPIPAFVVDKNHQVTHWNKALEELSGIPAKDIIGKNEGWRAFYATPRPCLADLLLDSDLEQVPVLYDGKAWKSKLLTDAYEGEDFFSKLGSEGKWLHFTAAPIRNSSGEVICVMETFQDITERKRWDEALQKSQEKFSKAFNATPAVITIITVQDVRCTEVNDAFVSITGYSRQEAIGRTLPEIGIFSDPCDVARLLQKLMAEGRLRNEECRFRAKSGEMLSGLVSAELIEIDNVPHIITVTANITELKRAEEHLRLDESRLEALLKLNQMAELPMGEITDFSLEEAVRLTKSKVGFLAFLNADETVLSIHAWSREVMAQCEMAQKQILFPVKSLGLLGEPVRQRKPVIVNDYPTPLLSKNGYPEGHTKITRYLSVPVLDAEHVVAVASVGNKETDYDDADVRQLTLFMQGMWGLLRRQNEKTLQESEERFRTLVQRAPEAILVYDTEQNRLTDANRKAEALFGCTREELLKSGLERFFLPDAFDHRTVEEKLREFNALAGTGEEVVFEQRIRTEAGKEIACEVRLVQLSTDNPHLIRASLIDITDRKRALDEARKAKDEFEHRMVERTAQLEAFNKEWETFSTSIFQGLQVPLNPIRTFTQLLHECCGNKLDRQAREYLDRILTGCGRMAQMIDDLEHFAHLSRAAMHPTWVDLSSLAQAIAADLQSREPQRKVRVLIAPELLVFADENLMRIVLERLLENAWKFTRKQPLPKIEFGATHEDGKPIFFVRDNGVGFNRAFADKLFNCFQRLHSDEEFEGQGIGLAIVRRIVCRHAGRAWAEGEVNKGATFFFTVGTL